MCPTVPTMTQNKTTVEHHEGVTAGEYYRSQGQSFRHPYDVGTLENVRQVLGQRYLAWAVPGTAAAGDGVRFPNSLAAHARTRILDEPQRALSGAGQLTDRKRDAYTSLLA